MSLPEIVSREEWLQARRRLLDEEKGFTRRRDVPIGEWKQPAARARALVGQAAGAVPAVSYHDEC